MLVEFRADGLMSTCRLFAAKANMRLETTFFEKAREAGQEIMDAFGEGIIYSRQNIEKIDSKTESILSGKRLSSVGITFDEQLSLHRYYFEQRFKPNTPEEIVDKAWWNMQDIERVCDLLSTKESVVQRVSIMSRLILEQGIDMTNGNDFDLLEIGATTEIPFLEIQNAFDFKKKCESGKRHQLVADIFNAYFGSAGICQPLRDENHKITRHTKAQLPRYRLGGDKWVGIKQVWNHLVATSDPWTVDLDKEIIESLTEIDMS